MDIQNIQPSVKDMIYQMIHQMINGIQVTTQGQNTQLTSSNHERVFLVIYTTAIYFLSIIDCD